MFIVTKRVCGLCRYLVNVVSVYKWSSVAHSFWKWYSIRQIGSTCFLGIPPPVVVGVKVHVASIWTKVLYVQITAGTCGACICWFCTVCRFCSCFTRQPYLSLTPVYSVVASQFLIHIELCISSGIQCLPDETHSISLSTSNHLCSSLEKVCTHCLLLRTDELLYLLIHLCILLWLSSS